MNDKMLWNVTKTAKSRVVSGRAEGFPKRSDALPRRQDACHKLRCSLHLFLTNSLIFCRFGVRLFFSDGHNRPHAFPRSCWPAFVPNSFIKGDLAENESIHY